MLFNSLLFLFFFLAVHQIYWRVQAKHRIHWLLISSCVFYGSWSWIFLLHFLGMVALTYACIFLLLKKRSKMILALAVSINLLNLFFFKYTSSVLTYIADDFGLASAGLLRDSLGIILPLAISFYTFQMIAFIVDVYRGQVKQVSLEEFAVFIMFFPQLIAGPIMRHQELLPHLHTAKLNQDQTIRGFYLILLGLIKKVLIADELAVLINPVWANPTDFNNVSIILAVLGFSAQVYCDFSGYSDMARGQAKLLGYEIPENFTFPYLATSFAELWRRWHITLSTWLRDYLYIPLGGNRQGPGRSNFNLIVVMSLGGVWHGNTITYFFWGFFHGVFQAIERYFGFDKNRSKWLYIGIGYVYTTIGWYIGVIFFRSGTMKVVGQVYAGFVKTSGALLEQPVQCLQLIVFAYLLQAMNKYQEKIKPYLLQYWKPLLPLAGVVIFYLIANIRHPAAEFIYFQF